MTGDQSTPSTTTASMTEPPTTAPAAPPAPGLRKRLSPDEIGMATAEYAIATVAAAGFAGLLLLILRSDEVRGMLLGIVRGALSV